MRTVVQTVVLQRAIERQTTTSERQASLTEQLLEEQRITNRWLAHISERVSS